MTYVLDANAMIALLRQEAGWEVVRDLLIRGGNRCVAHGINLCEVYYGFARAGGQARAETAIRDLYLGGIELREEMDTPFWQDAGRIRAVYGVPFADSFCIALACRISGELVTADHKDFDPVAHLGLCPVRFIR
jgi:predicted nucleic acid-binding protein